MVIVVRVGPGPAARHAGWFGAVRRVGAVTTTQRVIRNGRDMANEAFALSPISASAALPSDNDYQAISDAFMETTRGRWFLTEYARRNRNADTAMVLAAVERIETTIAAQKQVASTAMRAEADEAMRAIVAQARASATGAIDRFAEAQVFAPAQRGLRIIREVAWRLREVGYDSRICDILEAQADAIDANHDPSLTQELRAAVATAFEAIDRQITDLAASGDAADAVAEAAPPSASQTVSEVAQDDAITLDDETVAEAPVAAPAPEDVPQLQEAAATTPVPDLHLAPAPVARPHVVETTTAPSPDVVEAPPAAARPAAPPHLAAVPREIMGPSASEEIAPAPPTVPVPPSAVASPLPANALSLGESLLARGMVATPASAKADPLAPIRRMSQAEKIAFFS